MIDEKNTTLQIFGCLLKKPSILGQTDKYSLTLNDFSSGFEKRLFATIYNLYEQGAKQLGIIDIDNYIKDSPASYKIWEKERGIEYLQDAEDLTDLGNFDYYYQKLKKINCIRSLKKIGYDTSCFYEEDMLNPDREKINEKFDTLTARDIIQAVKMKITDVEKDVGIGSANKVFNATDGIGDLLKTLKIAPDTGCRLQGKYFNTIVRGARTGKFYIRSAASGTGKTRSMVGDACYMAYPIRYNHEYGQWEWAGACEKAMVIVTEQEKQEVQTMVLSYLTGINEEVILYGKFSEEQEKLLQQAIQIMSVYSSNLHICEMANPNIEQLKQVVSENVLTNNIKYVFYDYIFSNPALLNEFRDLRVREDVALGLLSAALKDIAVEYDVFVLSSTQTNAQGEDSSRAIKNESVVRGARSIIDKADMACVMSRPTPEELNIVETYCKDGILPNVVTDIYKMRRGKYTQVRIWSYFDLGICRKEDLFVTDSRLSIVKVDNLKQQYEEDDWSINSNISMLNLGIDITQETVDGNTGEIVEVKQYVEKRVEEGKDIFGGLL
jgi:replicative DNA helicase